MKIDSKNLGTNTSRDYEYTDWQAGDAFARHVIAPARQSGLPESFYPATLSVKENVLPFPGSLSTQILPP